MDLGVALAVPMRTLPPKPKRPKLSHKKMMRSMLQYDFLFESKEMFDPNDKNMYELARDEARVFESS